MERREFVQHLSVGAAFFLCGNVAALFSSGSHLQEETYRRLLANFPSLESAKRLGQLFLDKHPQEANAERIVRSLWGAESDSATWRESDLEHKLRKLESRIRTDFERERVVYVEGWILSETEVHFCVLAAIS